MFEENLDQEKIPTEEEITGEIMPLIIDRSMTDIANAGRFNQQHKGNIVFCPELTTWYHYEKGRWEPNNPAVFQLAKETCQSIFSEAENPDLSPEAHKKFIKHAKSSCRGSGIRSMLKMAQTDPDLIVHADQFDADPLVLNCTNGTLNLVTGELREHRPEDYLAKQVLFPYDETALCPTWERFVLRVMGGKVEMVAYLQRVFGYALTGSVKEQCLFLLMGNGSNGKTTMLETIRAVLGNHAVHSPSSTLLTKSGKGGISNDIARLQGARFFSAVEVGLGSRLDEATVKQLTGGDRISARYLYREYAEFTPTFKIFMATNHKPTIKGIDEGIWRRIHLIGFDTPITGSDVDMELPDKLKEEAQGILAWLVAGCLAWQQQGLNPPAEVVAASNAYREEQDTVAQFLEDGCTLGDGLRASPSTLYDGYKAWAVNNCQEVLGGRAFGNNMSQRGFVQVKSNGSRYWTNIKLGVHPRTNSGVVGPGSQVAQ